MRIPLTATFVGLGVAVYSASVDSQIQTTGLQWGPCPEYPDAGLSCAYFNIPLDYHNASAGNGHILVVKANATVGESKGTIFMNPGEGPLIALRSRSGR